MKYFKHKPFFALLVVMLLGSSFAFSQRQISGTVVDIETGEPLIGASVRAVGANAGAITDVEGKYSFQVPEGVTQIEVSYTGFGGLTLDIGAGNVVDVRMAPGIALEETVIIGYGTVKKEDATGSILAVQSKDFNKGALSSPQELIVGKIAGVAVTPNADPGGGATIRIRGGSSLSASNDPLIVIDGVPVGNETVSGARTGLNVINPNDIETFTVLKDASATAIYGSRASNGVILITTKKGSLKRKIGVEYNANVSFGQRIKEVDALNADEFRTLIRDYYDDNHPAQTLLGNANTDWQSQVYQTAFGHDHNLAASGGVGQIPYRVSLGYTDRSGVIKTDEFNRLTGALNLSPGFLNNTLQVNLNAKVMKSKNRFANRGAIGSAIFFDPTQPVYDQNSPYGGYFTYVNAVDGTPNPLASANPLAQLELHDDKSDVTQFITNLQVDYRFWFLPDLRANLNIALDKSDSEGSIFEPATYSRAFVNGGYDKKYTQEKENKVLEFYLNYVKSIGNSKLDLMAGYSWQHFFFDNYSVAKNIAGDKILEAEILNPREYFLVSLFGRVNLSITDRFLLTGTLRRDGSSRFASDNRFGLFPSAAFAWKIVKDRPGSFNSLKLRLGYGETGQQDIGDKDYYPYLARYQKSTESAQYQLGNQYYYTLRPNGYDAKIKWEQTATYNAGLDFGFFDNRLNGSAEVYLRKTSDLLNFIPIPAGTNLTNFIFTNVGDLENKGVELSLNTLPIKRPNFSWEVGGNVTFNKNKITRLTATDDPNYQGVATGDIAGGVGNKIQIHSVGYPANSFLVYEQVYDL
ncbi:MAG: SusC/RagA family TonB-linked outer membrane protein, partial [Saprospiraceae bacterium]|nr:SusC/RagA family TonB-linked outer membrane protein [Saprospiraceae bacterium]